MPAVADADHIEDIKARLRLQGFGRIPITHELQRLGRISTKHIVLRMAKEWTASQSWQPIGMEKRIKHGRTHLRKPIQYSLTQCYDTNRGDRPAL